MVLYKKLHPTLWVLSSQSLPTSLA